MKSLAKSTLMLFALTGCSGSEATQAEDTPVDWVKAYDDTQNAHSLDYLLNCWANQWPEGVRPAEGPAAAAENEIERAIRATREHCQLEMQVRLDQIHIDLARQGVEPPEVETAALRKLETELDGMFGEYWSRL